MTAQCKHWLGFLYILRTQLLQSNIVNYPKREGAGIADKFRAELSSARDSARRQTSTVVSDTRPFSRFRVVSPDTLQLQTQPVAVFRIVDDSIRGVDFGGCGRTEES